MKRDNLIILKEKGKTNTLITQYAQDKFTSMSVLRQNETF